MDLHGHLTHRVGGEGKVEFKTLENLEDSDEVRGVVSWRVWSFKSVQQVKRH